MGRDMQAKQSKATHSFEYDRWNIHVFAIICGNLSSIILYNK